MLILVPSLRELRGIFPDAAIEPSGEPVALLPSGHRVAACGIGLAAAGARAGALLAGSRGPAILVGLAGTFDEDSLPLGALLAVTSAELSGIGIAEDEGCLSVHSVFGREEEAPSLERSLLTAPAGVPDAVAGAVLSVAAASGSPAVAARRAARHPTSLAEDMETWAVLAAARATGVPLRVLRGISNRVGERDHSTWRFEEAFAVLRAALSRILDGEP